MEVRILHRENINRDLFTHFVRRQVVVDCWRFVEGEWVIKPDPFVDDWDESDYQKLIANLRETISQRGIVLGAFLEGKLKGFAAVKAGLFGANMEYLDLACLHVSKDVRGRGIGRVLFTMTMEWAKANGAKKLYISAHSSIESQAFYRAMGCVQALEVDVEHVRLEPYDCQLECIV